MLITPTGLTVETYDELLAQNITLWGTTTGEVDVAPSSASGELVAITTEMEARSKQDIADAYAQTNPSTATDTYLDLCGALINMPRLKNVKTIAYVTVTATDGYYVDSNKSFTCVDNGEIFYSQHSATVAGGVAYVSIESQNIGVSCPAGTIELTVPEIGVVVTNNRAGKIGFISEPDIDYRARIQSSGTPASTHLKDGLYHTLLSVDGVTDVNIVDNDTDVPMFDVPARNFCAVVLGGNPAEFCRYIYASMGGGNPSFGTTSQNTVSASGQTYQVYYTRPTEVAIAVAITLTTDADFDVDTGAATVKSNVVDYINGLSIGDNVLIQTVAGLCMINGVTDVSVTLNGFPVSIFSDYKEIPYTTPSAVVIS